MDKTKVYKEWREGNIEYAIGGVVDKVRIRLCSRRMWLMWVRESGF